MALFGLDLSNNNWHSNAEAVADVQRATQVEGFAWIEHKVSEGSGYRDPYWPAVRDWCNANNVPVIGYHYVRTDDPAAQAKCFVNNGGGKNVMLDFEDGSGNIANFWAVVRAFNAAGVNVVLSYIPHWYWQNIGSPDLTGVPGLVSSSYYERNNYASKEYYDAGGDNGAGWASYGGATPVIWQFTDAAIVAGISVDANAFKGDVNALRALLGYPITTTTGGGSVSNQPATPKPVDVANQVSQVWDQLLIRWDFLNGNTPVEALGVIGAALKLPGYSDPTAK